MQLFRLVAAACAAGCLIAGSLPAAAAVTVPDAPPATITVTGQGQVSRAPDLATVAVTLITNDDNAAHALSENNRRYAALVARLAANGIAADNITSTSISSYFSARPSGTASNAPGQFYGFVVTRNAQINVSVLAQTGPVVDAATAAGATQIDGVSYGFRDRRAVERAAMAAAVADAYAQAQAVAAAAHVTIVGVVRISSEAASGRIGPMAMSMAKSEAPLPTTISPSDLDVSASITVTYSIR